MSTEPPPPQDPRPRRISAQPCVQAVPAIIAAIPSAPADALMRNPLLNPGRSADKAKQHVHKVSYTGGEGGRLHAVPLTRFEERITTLDDIRLPSCLRTCVAMADTTMPWSSRSTFHTPGQSFLRARVAARRQSLSPGLTKFFRESRGLDHRTRNSTETHLLKPGFLPSWRLHSLELVVCADVRRHEERNAAYQTARISGEQRKRVLA